MEGKMVLQIWDVEHGACAMLIHSNSRRLAMIDSGDNASTGWRPSQFIKESLKRSVLDYLFVTNADQDHLSDLNGLWEEGIEVKTLYRNREPDAKTLRSIKETQGELTDDIERFLSIHDSYNAPVTEPFDDFMGGITVKTFKNSYPRFQDTNNLSLVVFVKYLDHKFLFPGDMEKHGWLALLEQPAFVKELAGTTVLVASHHGRENGFCPEIFDHFNPQVVVISDKPIVHATQEMVPDYRKVTLEAGVKVATTGKHRHVLTTRRDGSIVFTIDSSGMLIETEYKG